jgi:hypothetical protein
MSPNISVSESLFARLQQHAVAFVDTPETVIARALDTLETGEPIAAPAGGKPRSFNPASPPNLAFTTPRKITLNGATFAKGETYWNTLMFAAIKAAAAKGCSPQQIVKMMEVPHALGKKEDNGYVFIEEAGISVQGQTSNGAWKQSNRIAEELKIPLHVEFIWQNTEKAAMPNAAGVFDVNL